MSPRRVGRAWSSLCRCGQNKEELKEREREREREKEREREREKERGFNGSLIGDISDPKD